MQVSTHKYWPTWVKKCIAKKVEGQNWQIYIWKSFQLGRYIKVCQVVCNNIIPNIQKQIAFSPVLNKSVTVKFLEIKALGFLVQAKPQ